MLVQGFILASSLEGFLTKISPVNDEEESIIIYETEARTELGS